MLVKYDEPVTIIKSQDERLSGYDIQCLKKGQRDFSMYVFTIQADSSTHLRFVWEPLTNAIASYFQTNLDKDIERWNIYVVFVVQDRVDKGLKYRIEQNRFSCRKLVIDEARGDDIINVCDLIEKKLFSLQLKIRGSETKGTVEPSITSVLQDKNPALLSILMKPFDKQNIGKLLDEYMR